MLTILLLFLISSNIVAKELITPLPQIIKYDKQKAALGKKLFSDPRLSRDNTTSCESCHFLTAGGADSKRFSIGVGNRVGILNAPTVFNSVFNFSQHWDGSAKNLKDQAHRALFNLNDLDINEVDSIKKLQKDSEYQMLFKNIYPDGITVYNITDAIAEFEKALITPNSKFDRYLRGESRALNEQEREGYMLFKSFGCISCHNGVNIGGNLYQKLGIIKPYPNNKNQFGRYNVTKKQSDKYYFKVPTLRNIELTAPYLHDGSAAKIEDVIKVMIEYQTGRISSKEDILNIKSFLLTLTGDRPEILGDN